MGIMITVGATAAALLAFFVFVNAKWPIRSQGLGRADWTAGSYGPSTDRLGHNAGHSSGGCSGGCGGGAGCGGGGGCSAGGCGGGGCGGGGSGG